MNSEPPEPRPRRLTRTQKYVKRCVTPPSRTTPERRPLAVRRAPRHAALLGHGYVGGARPAARLPAPTRHSHQRATPRAYHLWKIGCWRRPYSRPSEGSWCAAVAAARGALVPGGEARTTASDREARRGARRAESPPDDRVPLWRALFDRAEEPPRPGQCEERGLREAAEPRSLRHGKQRGRGVRKEPRPGAVEPWGRARRRQAASAHASCREPPSLAARERG